jgi:hypothetical protein
VLALTDASSETSVASSSTLLLTGSGGSPSLRGGLGSRHAPLGTLWLEPSGAVSRPSPGLPAPS